MKKPFGPGQWSAGFRPPARVLPLTGSSPSTLTFRRGVVIVAGQKGSTVFLLETYFELPHRLDVRIDSLGRDYRAKHNGLAITVRLPRVHPSGKSSFLAAPEFLNVFADDGFSSKILGEHFYWGLESRENSGDKSSGTATVFAIGLSTTCALGSEQQSVNELTDAMNDWWPSVCDWIEVLTRQVHSGPGTASSLGFNHPIWLESCGDVKRLFQEHPIYIHRDHNDGLEAPAPITVDLLEASLARAGEVPPTEWLLIRDGRVAHHQGSRRRAVIDAGTAVELAVTELIRQCQPNLTEKQLEKQLKGHRTLGPRTALFQNLGGVLPSGTDKLVWARNRAAHQGANPPAADSSRALLTAAEIVEAAYPLASFQ
jgi:hypothetical protein